MTSGRRHALEGAYATFALFTAFSGQFWRNLLGWWGFGVIALLVVAGAAWLWWSRRPQLSWRRVPKSTLAFLLIAVASVAWSNYPGTTAVAVALTLATTFVALSLALSLGWHGFLRALGGALKWLLALSLLFELWVAVFVREPLLPNFPDFDPDAESIPMAFYWSRALLFEGGPIEGVIASRNLLAMAALLALILFGALLASGGMRRAQGIGWLTVAGLVFVLTRSATVILVAVIVLVALGFALWARRLGPDRRRRVYAAAAATLAASVALLALSWNALLELFGKGEDLTGRLDIWEAVIGLATERPWLGWGWVSYWAPWVEPYDDLAVRKGVEYLQAHNAWLDVWMQLGVLGLIAFASIVIGALWRSWFLAVDPPMDDRGTRVPYTAASLIPLLALVALVGQSLAESRILIESGWLLLVAIAWGTKQRQWTPEPLPALTPTRSPRRFARPRVRP
ncbi:O-antigen ligase family protein [Agromyces indicus]|uniref:O-antigen ligase family protein n=1 Tax=Agromyces indicus TaxID=758919 RepID=A0ABU1FNK7_9MICO|nr:O-antigen ligase family protein [Agromyces indicus]MDR5693335.1 O-antigen ligase family protein [Agromyces indicus]